MPQDNKYRGYLSSNRPFQPYLDKPQEDESMWSDVAGYGLAAVGLAAGGYAAFRTGLLRAPIQSLLRHLGEYEEGAIVKAFRGVREWTKGDYAKEGISGLLKNFDKLPGAISNAMGAEKDIMPTQLEKLLAQRQAASGVTNPHDVGGNFDNMYWKTIEERFTVSRAQQEQSMRTIGYRKATLGEMIEAGKIDKDDKFIKELLAHFEVTSTDGAGNQIKSNKALNFFVDKDVLVSNPVDGALQANAHFSDLRRARRVAYGTIDSMANDFTFPFANLNPLRMFYINNLFKIEEAPIFHVLKGQNINPILAGKLGQTVNEKIGQDHIFINGSIFNIATGAKVMDNAYLSDSQAGPVARLLRIMSNTVVSTYKGPRPGKLNNFLYNVADTMDLGFQDEPLRKFNLFDPTSWISGFAGFLDKRKPWEYEQQKKLIHAFSDRPDFIVMQGTRMPWESSMKDFFSQFAAGRGNMQDVTTATLFPFAFFERINATLNQAGVGLSVRSQSSMSDIFVNLLLRRGLPIMGGIAAWNYTNDEMNDITGTNFKKMGAGAYVGMSQQAAKARDALGITKWAKHFSQLLPGGDQITEIPGFGHFLDWTKSSDETKKYWADGETAIRKGRWWPFGNTPFTGSKIDHYEPNWYRQVKSDWKYTSTLYGSADEYWANAPIPTPTHPFAPIRHFITDPYHWEKKHYYDRPYLYTGGFAEMEEIPIAGPGINATIGQMLKPTKKMHLEVWAQIQNGQMAMQAQANQAKVARPRAVFTNNMDANPNDTYFKYQWNMQATHVPQAWGELGENANNKVTVAVIDTGVDTRHPDLRGKLLPGYNAVDGTTDVTDRMGHGTHVAGIVGASANNKFGVAGVGAPVVQIMPIKVFGDDGYASNESIRRGLQYALARGADVVNMSLGSSNVLEPFDDLLQLAYKRGTLVVGAAGNESQAWMSGPVGSPETLAVGALDPNMHKAEYSNYGYGLDVTAPGSDILSTVPGGFKMESGTSMASPFVAAVAALTKAQNPTLTPAELRFILEGTAQDRGPKGWDENYGAGSVDPVAAVKAAKNTALSVIKQGGINEDINIRQQRAQLLQLLQNNMSDTIAAVRGAVDKYNRPVAAPQTLPSVTGRMWQNIKEMGGFYGFVADSVGGGTQGPVIADARAMYSYRRSFWDMQIGGFGGDLNEIGRRFIGQREKWEKSYNPIPNQMPSWMPGENYFTDFRHGDPYVKVMHGEIRLPGEAYEKMYGLKDPTEMSIGASSVGGSVQDIIKHLLHQDEAIDDDMKDILNKGTSYHAREEKKLLKAGVAIDAEQYLEDKKLHINGFYDMRVRNRRFLEYYSKNGILNMQGLNPEVNQAIIDFKTMGQKKYDANHTYQKNVEQINFYMYATGIHRAYLVHINRDDPKAKAKVYALDYNPELLQQTVAKVQTARSQVRQMVQDGVIGWGDLYDYVDRYRILADVAPYSDEFKMMKKLVRQGDLKPNELEELKEINDQVHSRKDPHRLYPYRFKTANIKRETVTVDRFIDNNTFYTKEHPDNPIRLAGVRVSNAKDNEMADRARKLIHSYVKRGQKVEIGYDGDKLNQIKNDTYSTIQAVVYGGMGSNLNYELIKRGFGKEKTNDYSPAAVHARFTPREIRMGSAWETVAHMDTPINTKFMQVRSALESYKRRDLYGKDWQDWKHPYKDFVQPWYQNLLSRNPVGAVIGGMALGWFAGNPQATHIVAGKTVPSYFGRFIGAAIGGLAVGAGLLYKGAYQATSGQQWVPERRRREWEINEYADILKYVKANKLFNDYAKAALREEGTDVVALLERQSEQLSFNKGQEDLLNKYKHQLHRANDNEAKKLIKQMNEQLKKRGLQKVTYTDKKQAMHDINRLINQVLDNRKSIKLLETTPIASAAIDYYKQSKQTMYGYESGDPVQNILGALPKKDRDYLMPFVNAPEEERAEILRTTPPYMRRVLESMWGLPVEAKPKLSEYFRSHELPSPTWHGWDEDVDLDDIKVKIVKHEGMDNSEFNIWPDNEAKAAMLNPAIETPNVNRRSSSSQVKQMLHNILRETGLSNLQVDVLDGENGIEVDADIEHDRRDELQDYIENNAHLLV